ncbi:hypothetical protein PHLGIDRAFT_26949 [Phlebiopsis gigantea 11061_1 CR5-6]|uniref:Uncharacterized protein n=1 Tax=Phlebiopsis gigantea (strain 11061_1 CR5-6) TaxID=745531 RepID=A0A0C3RPR4_PHLG1|nr:hypothetical protein PHLGIDRAFT_26949 [Phlebiopsis gigantea 11061_1 CR5-6]
MDPLHPLGHLPRLPPNTSFQGFLTEEQQAFECLIRPDLYTSAAARALRNSHPLPEVLPDASQPISPRVFEPPYPNPEPLGFINPDPRYEDLDIHVFTDMVDLMDFLRNKRPDLAAVPQEEIIRCQRAFNIQICDTAELERHVLQRPFNDLDSYLAHLEHCRVSVDPVPVLILRPGNQHSTHCTRSLESTSIKGWGHQPAEVAASDVTADELATQLRDTQLA